MAISREEAQRAGSRARHQQNGTAAGATPNGQTKPREPTWDLVSATDFVRGFQPPSYLIDGIALRSRLYSLTGKTGHGKTAVGLTMAISIVRGQPLAGRRVKPGRAVYLAAENPDDIRMRLILMADRLGLDLDSLPLHFVAAGFDLAGGMERLRTKVQNIGGAESVFVDTGAAFLAHGNAEDENSNMTLLRFALDLRNLTELPGRPAAIALMHPVKNAVKDNLIPRGGGAFLNEMDGNLTVWAEDSHENAELHWGGKLRGPSFEPIHFALESGCCEALVDAEGRAIPSVWARPITASEAEQQNERHSDDAGNVLLLLKEGGGAKSLRKMAEH